MNRIAYLNGGFLPAADASVNITDGGLLHAAGLFETMRAENGRVFRLESHLNRLMNSASKLLRPIDREALPSRVDFLELLQRNELSVARVRLTVTAGPMQTSGDDGENLTVCATAVPLAGHPREAYDNGLSVALCNYRVSPTDPLAGHKTTSYLPRLLALRDAQRIKCAEALWFTTGNQLAEGCISNVFVVKDGGLKTPPVETPVLPGIARGVVLEMARRSGITAQECPLTIDDLLDADEVFVTSSILLVMPVVRIEKHDLSEGRVGPIAKQLLQSYREIIRKECGAE